jgi:hypothetical protein
MTLTTLRRCLAAGVLTAATAVAAAPAGAQRDAGGSAPVPASAGDLRLVIKDVAIFDAAGAELRSWHCEWTDPQDDDKPCLAFSGDPQSAYREIQDAGGSTATVKTRVPDLEIDTVTDIAARADGTWLFRTQGKIDGKPHYAGSVCSADGRTCTRYEATSKRRAKRAIAAATAKLKKRARAR